MAKEYKKRDPKFKVFIRHDRANTEELVNVGSRATLNGARKLAVAKLKAKLDKGIYDYTADITSIKTGRDVGTVAYHPKKGAFFITGKVTNFRNGSVPTAFPIAPDGSLLRPVGSTTYKKIAKEPAVRARKKGASRGKRISKAERDRRQAMAEREAEDEYLARMEAQRDFEWDVYESIQEGNYP